MKIKQIIADKNLPVDLVCNVAGVKVKDILNIRGSKDYNAYQITDGDFDPKTTHLETHAVSGMDKRVFVVKGMLKQSVEKAQKTSTKGLAPEDLAGLRTRLKDVASKVINDLLRGEKKEPTPTPVLKRKKKTDIPPGSFAGTMFPGRESLVQKSEENQSSFKGVLAHKRDFRSPPRREAKGLKRILENVSTRCF
jgi:hypothetical protein